MKPALPLLVFAVTGFTAGAQQLSILPQVGVENSRTTLRYNDLSCFSPAGSQASPRLGLRMDYQFKKAHGLFLGAATSRSVVSFSFADPQTGMTMYKASPSDMRLHLETGYQFSSKPIYFKKTKAVSKPATASVSTVTVKRGCGGYYSYKSRCQKSPEKAIAARPKDKGWYMRIQPSLGAAFVRSAGPDVSTQSVNNQTTYKYQAGNWTTAVIGGAGFEFGKNVTRKFTVSLNYLKGINNLGTKSITTVSEGKNSVTNVRSAVSAWSVSAGIPITLWKKRSAVIEQKAESYSRPEKKYMQYRSRCGRSI